MTETRTVHPKSPATPAAVSSKTGPPVMEERIRIRAYELFEARMGQSGDAESDWFRAEAEIIEKTGQTPKGSA
jgi:hypothetical protein